MIYYGKELYHFGIKGQKHGVRNYQNPDGSYTEKAQAENNGHGRYYQNYQNEDGSLTKEGKERYAIGNGTYKDLKKKLYTIYENPNVSRYQISDTPKGFITYKVGNEERRILDDFEEMEKIYKKGREEGLKKTASLLKELGAKDISFDELMYSYNKMSEKDKKEIDEFIDAYADLYIASEYESHRN